MEMEEGVDDDVKVENGVKLEEDADNTPPLSPHSNKPTDTAGDDQDTVPPLDSGGSKTLRRTKPNTRMATRRRGSCKTSVATISSTEENGRSLRSSQKYSHSSSADYPEVWSL